MLFGNVNHDFPKFVVTKAYIIRAEEMKTGLFLLYRTLEEPENNELLDFFVTLWPCPPFFLEKLSCQYHFLYSFGQFECVVFIYLFIYFFFFLDVQLQKTHNGLLIVPKCQEEKGMGYLRTDCRYPIKRGGGCY